MSICRQDSLSDEGSSLSGVTASGMALNLQNLQFKTSISSTSSCSTQTTSETVVHHMVGMAVQTSGNGLDASTGLKVSASENDQIQQAYPAHVIQTQHTQSSHHLQGTHNIHQTHGNHQSSTHGNHTHTQGNHAHTQGNHTHTQGNHANTQGNHTHTQGNHNQGNHNQGNNTQGNQTYRIQGNHTQGTHSTQGNHGQGTQPALQSSPPDWGTIIPQEDKNPQEIIEGEMRRKDQLIEELIKLHPAHGLNKVRGGEAEEALRSDLAGMTVKVERLEQQVRDAGASNAAKDARITELSRQLDAHRQEHARQAATIVTLRQKLQEEEATTTSLRANQRRGEYTVGALTRETRQQSDRINELENRLKTHLEEREAAEQRSEASHKRLLELVRMVTSCLSLGDLDPQDAHEKLSTKLAGLVQECARLRSEVLRTTEDLEQRESEAGAARQTVGRLVNELDDEKHTVEEQKKALEDYRREVDDLKTKLRAVEEEVKSVRERLHNTNKSYNTTLEELHTAERQLQRAKDESVVTEHRRQQTDAESRGFMTTVAALLSTPDNRISPDPQAITDRIQAFVGANREAAEHVERLTAQVTSLGEQSRRHTELYETAVKRGRQTDADLHSITTRCRQLEADQAAAEASRENLLIEKEKAMRTLGRVIEALGLVEMGHEVTNDVEMIVCRCQQLAKLEGEKIVDKTTTVYQLQRKVKGLREAVERKDLHVDMLRRKLALTEDAARASRQLEEERDEIIAKYKRQCRVVERLNAEMAETRLQLRDVKAQLTQAADDKNRYSQMDKKIEEMTSKIDELDSIRSRQLKKISHLKEQVKAQGEHALEERRLSENSLEGVTQELALAKQSLRDVSRREKQLSEFRRTVVDLLGGESEPGVEGDYEAICKLERVVGAHRELTDLSRRLDEITAPSRPGSARTITSRSPTLRSPSQHSSPSPLGGHRMDSPSRFSPDQSFLDLSEELRALADDAHNHRPPPIRHHQHPPRRPPSAHARSPSPTKRPSTDEDEDS